MLEDGRDAVRVGGDAAGEREGVAGRLQQHGHPFGRLQDRLSVVLGQGLGLAGGSDVGPVGAGRAGAWGIGGVGDVQPP
ncbi:hypothetical protein GCM10014713_44910 [Streptomyces purpureus]|uniref:Uncharacterized protein n=1 Tax=Streptomyces purpureus TaxID=1951 RepID=A0A918H9H6_9ACTN|nr:hypothetical protein GCM10014713_44910 [Streptomyces purpureus]